MQASQILSYSEAAGAALLGLSSVWFSRRAASNSKATSNGWTEGLGKRLDAQDAALARVEARAEKNADALVRVESQLHQHVRDHWLQRDDGK
jgi:hypothetical protein